MIETCYFVWWGIQSGSTTCFSPKARYKVCFSRSGWFWRCLFLLKQTFPKREIWVNHFRNVFQVNAELFYNFIWGCKLNFHILFLIKAGIHLYLHIIVNAVYSCVRPFALLHQKQMDEKSSNIALWCTRPADKPNLLIAVKPALPLFSLLHFFN